MEKVWIACVQRYLLNHRLNLQYHKREPLHLVRQPRGLSSAGNLPIFIPEMIIGIKIGKLPAELRPLGYRTNHSSAMKKAICCGVIRESNRLKYRSGSGSGSRNFIFNGSVPVQVQDFFKNLGSGSVRVQLHHNLMVRVRFGFIETKFLRAGSVQVH